MNVESCQCDGPDCKGRLWVCLKCQTGWCQAHKGQHTNCTAKRVLTGELVAKKRRLYAKSLENRSDKTA